MLDLLLTASLLYRGASRQYLLFWIWVKKLKVVPIWYPPALFCGQIVLLV